MNIAAIMPCRGRPDQTVANVRRLLATAGYPFQLICVVDGDPELFMMLWEKLNGAEVIASIEFSEQPSREKVGYWRSLQAATDFALRRETHITTGEPTVTHFVNLANDLLPGMYWLRRAVEGYKQAFGDGPGLLGFNGDSHELLHSCHFLISRSLLDRYGGWPVWYDHNFGDTELCQRAQADGLYAKAPWAILFHNHHYFGADNNDAIYQEGEQHVSRDHRLFEWRKANNWPNQSLVEQTHQKVA